MLSAKVSAFVRHCRKIPRSGQNRTAANRSMHMHFEIGRLAGPEEGIHRAPDAVRVVPQPVRRNRRKNQPCQLRGKKCVRTVLHRQKPRPRAPQQYALQQTPREWDLPVASSACVSFAVIIVSESVPRQLPRRLFPVRLLKFCIFFAVFIYHIIYPPRLFIYRDFFASPRHFPDLGLSYLHRVIFHAILGIHAITQLERRCPPWRSHRRASPQRSGYSAPAPDSFWKEATSAPLSPRS